MRQLKISTETLARLHAVPTPESEAAAAEALQVLQALPLPADLPEFAQEFFSERVLRHMISVAETLVGNSGEPCTELAAAGHAAGVAAALRYRDEPSLFHRFGWWCIRVGINRQHDLSPRRQALLARHRAEEAAATLALAALPAPNPWAETHVVAPTELLFLFARDHEDQGLTFVELVLAGRNAVANYAPGPEQDPVRAQDDWKQRVNRAMLTAIEKNKNGGA